MRQMRCASTSGFAVPVVVCAALSPPLPRLGTLALRVDGKTIDLADVVDHDAKAS